MTIKNLTSDVQKVTVEDIFNDRVYEVYIEPHAVTTLDGVVLLHKDKLAGIIEVLGSPVKAEVSLELVHGTPSPEDESEEGDTEEDAAPEVQEEISQEDVAPVEENVTPTSASGADESQFVCDICGAEFASSRGLTSHKNRSHSHES